MIKLSIDNNPVTINFLTFSGGEEHAQLVLPTNIDMDDELYQIKLQAYLTNSQEVMRMFMVLDAITRIFPSETIDIDMPYYPYARQDRVCNEGEAFGAKVFAKLLESCSGSISSITVTDPHSDVIGGMFDADVIKVVPQYVGFINKLEDESRLLSYSEDKKGSVLVAPDAGSMKKTMELAKELDGMPVVIADKVRDTKTGNIVRTQVHDSEEVLQGKNVIIVDDICDGGRTFHELAKVLKEEHGVKTVSLYVTHGIFSKGVDFSEFIDEVHSCYDWVELGYTKIEE